MANVIDLSQPPVEVKRKHRASRQLLTREMLGNRSKTAQLFDRMLADIAADLAGDLTTMERSLCEGFVACAIITKHAAARLIAPNGEPIDIPTLVAAINTMGRTAKILGLKRRQRTVGATLGELLREGNRRD